MDVLDSLRPLLHQLEHLVKFCREKVQCSQNTAVGSEIIPSNVLASGNQSQGAEQLNGNTLLHDLLIINGISDVNIGLKIGARNGWVQVEYVWRRGWFLGVKVRVDPLHEGRFARTGHANGDDDHRLFLVGSWG